MGGEGKMIFMVTSNETVLALDDADVVEHARKVDVDSRRRSAIGCYLTSHPRWRSG